MLARSKQRQRQAVSNVASLPAPIRGWYVGESATDAKKGSALQLDNWFPLENKVRMRRGSIARMTGLPAVAIGALLVYEAGSVSKMFATVQGKLYDVSSDGAVGAAVISGLTNDRWEDFQFTTSGGTSYLLIFNGADTHRVYDGATWATNTPAITGVASATLAMGCVYQNRIFLVEKDTKNAWYLPVDSVGGAATKLPFGGFFTKGGSLLAIATWSVDSGSGQDDLIVFLSTNGEAVIFSGTNPSSPTSWALKGVYRLPKPLGRRCFLQMGGDLAIVTEDGIVPLSQAIQLDQAALVQKAITKPIAKPWRDAVAERAGLDGWQITLWRKESLAIVTLPLLSGEAGTQFVANISTGALARYISWPATCFAVFNNKLYFGTELGVVVEAETGGRDRGAAYSGTIVWPYHGFKDDAAVKVAQMARPIMESRVSIAPLISITVDFVGELPPPPAAAVQAVAGAHWDVDNWDQGIWAGALIPFNDWQGVTGVGTALSLGIQLTNDVDTTPDILLSRIDLLYQKGNVGL